MKNLESGDWAIAAIFIAMFISMAATNAAKARKDEAIARFCIERSTDTLSTAACIKAAK